MVRQRSEQCPYHLIAECLVRALHVRIGPVSLACDLHGLQVLTPFSPAQQPQRLDGVVPAQPRQPVSSLADISLPWQPCAEPIQHHLAIAEITSRYDEHVFRFGQQAEGLL